MNLNYIHLSTCFHEVNHTDAVSVPHGVVSIVLEAMVREALAET